MIEAHREGLIIGSACSYGEVFLSMVKRVSYNKRTHTRHITEQANPEEQERIASRYDYLEIQPVINNRFMLEEEFYLDGKRVETEDDLRTITKKLSRLRTSLESASWQRRTPTIQSLTMQFTETLSWPAWAMMMRKTAKVFT